MFELYSRKGKNTVILYKQFLDFLNTRRYMLYAKAKCRLSSLPTTSRFYRVDSL